MSIRVAINHKTHYQFDRLVSLSPHVFRLRPAVHCRTPVHAYSLRITPDNHFINWQQDPYGNFLARVLFPEKCRELTVEVDLIVEMITINPFDYFVEEYAEHLPFKYDETTKKELSSYLQISEAGERLKKWLAEFDLSQCKINDFLVNINRLVHQKVNYNIRMEAGVQSCEHTLKLESGSCRDSAWLLVQLFRHLGLAARFVSGYLVQLTADVKSLDGPSGPEQDFTDLHAWAEVYIPGAGWIGLDPTSGLLAGEGHIPLACTAEPMSAAPVTGATDVCETELEFTNSVTRIHEDPRVTKPYTEQQWCEANALGHRLDEYLEENDVRLTMGGEPTFVSIDDMESPQWNTDADGDDKRQLAQALTLKLNEVFSRQGLLHYGQGKWYPGEELPRWQYGCFWRKDGIAMWRNPARLADINQNYDLQADDAKSFMACLVDYLGVAQRFISPAYEDPFFACWQEGQVPTNLDPLKSRLKDPLERKNLAKVLNEKIGEASAFALPLKWHWPSGAWRSGPWQFRRGELFLISGDSPAGMRLPLDNLPWTAPDKRDPQEPQSQFDELPDLEDYAAKVAQRTAEASESAWVDVPHTALVVEAREGRLYVFMPPVSLLEHYLDILAAVEATAEQLKIPVVIEGYLPPDDYRLEKLMVTPDPGVIEVNIHPSRSWTELVEKTTVLYDQAHQVRLGTEKFMLDGRHSGTGGGNHITLGGLTPADSPMLRRPDLLRSLITYWQHHPGLSYLFSGMFIGPTSQAPRIDEGRDEKLYELEIAFQQMPTGETDQPWLVDRLLRHLLTDITGNTHRAEFSIDKLYSPDSATGRLGILELRAFEMPPHSRMALVQALLVRTLIARFWKQPYQHSLIRWGTELHDRFLMPHFVYQDMKQVVDDLQQAGFDFQMEWLAPFFEFRFPVYGTTQIEGMEVELRFAIEPWHVLGEEMSSSGTARFVDSSVERLQVKLSGFTEGRYMLTCNGRCLPLTNTGRKGEFVAGVRYRAWQPPSALHPTIAPHTPLVFDLFDTWSGRSIGGCTYHVSHPGGRHHDTFPVNSYEAEARRAPRFWDYGHTPAGQQTAAPQMQTQQQGEEFGFGGVFNAHPADTSKTMPKIEEADNDYPFTLDLRYRK